ncbi:MAG: hypothetical protein HYT22_00270 [Candidatus Niyogibacteria bacterium]|nr:hypothetical protein [Candidatus Niyogibacteria bacterium]
MGATQKKKAYIFFLGAANAVPLLVSAQLPSEVTNFSTRLNAVFTGIIGIIIALAGLVFLWGVFKFVSAAGDEKAREIGRQFIIWGLIGLTVMFVFWALVSILVEFIGGQGTIPDLPTPPRN